MYPTTPMQKMHDWGGLLVTPPPYGNDVPLCVALLDAVV